jgi:3',5'-cyclic AMP phosphodiesterase CpdA
MPWAESWRLWTDYMTGDPDTAMAAHGGFNDFPFLRRRGRLALIGLSTALPTPPGFASGRLGPAQLEALSTLLESAGEEGRCRVVLLHHPPTADVAWRKRLTDAPAFRRVIAARGAELVLHGHDHTTTHEAIDGRDGPVPVFGIASASQATADKRPASQYRIFSITPAAAGWQLDIALRAYDPARAAFKETAVESLKLTRPAA